VRPVLTGRDIGERYIGRAVFDWPALATDTVKFIGQYVVAVAAETHAQAQAAVASIDVTYEELPALLDSLRATDSSAPILHPNPEKYHFYYGSRPSSLARERRGWT
jgi:xanthine dehydrogenase molybdopterin-binding subunit B